VSTANRLSLIKIHMLLAAFIFPAALMFLVTGGLYTWDVKGSYANQVHIIELNEPLAADEEKLNTLISRELEKRSIELPSGKAKIKKGGTSFKVEWTGSERDVVLEPTTEPLAAKLIVKETTWYRQFVQLHKAKGGQLFKVYAAMLAISLFAILSTGFVLALQIPKYRKPSIYATLAGVAMFIFMVSFS
jgi:hypothetical protein